MAVSSYMYNTQVYDNMPKKANAHTPDNLAVSHFSTVQSQTRWPADLPDKFSSVAGYWQLASMMGNTQSHALWTLAVYNENKSIAPFWASLTLLPAHSAKRVNQGSSEHAAVLSHLDACLFSQAV